jgi:hypothetical protein
MLGASFNKDFFTREDIWKGDEVLPQAAFYKRTPEIYKDPKTLELIDKISIGRTEGMPVKTQYFVESFLTRGNIYTDIVGGLYKQITKDLPEDQKKQLNDDIVKKPFIRRAFKLTNPNIYREDKKLKERELLDNTIRLQNNRALNAYFDKVDSGVATRDDFKDMLNMDTVIEIEGIQQRYKKSQPEKKRLFDRTRRYTRLKGLDKRNKRILLDIFYNSDSPEVRAYSVVDHFVTLDRNGRIQFLKDVELFPGLSSDRFKKALIEYRKQLQ